jgi:hypothetical protein
LGDGRLRLFAGLQCLRVADTLEVDH